MLKIAIQGQQGSYHEQVARRVFDEQIELICCETFADLFEAIKTEQADYAVCAIANNRYGFIDEPYALLMDDAGQNVRIVGEHTLAIQHQLLGLKNANLSDIKHVYSQLPALGQCTKFLETKLPKAEINETKDTAAAALTVAEIGDVYSAAIASAEAGELAGLGVIAENVQDDERNLTRFLILQPNKNLSASASACKSSILLTTGNQPGALLKVLEIFKNHDINLTMLHSAFVPNTDFEMRFWLEFSAGLNNEQAKLALQEIQQNSENKIEILGQYHDFSVTKRANKNNA